MPGVNPPAAVEAFLSPLRGALACVGQCHITLQPGSARTGRARPTPWTLLYDGARPQCGSSDGFHSERPDAVRDPRPRTVSWSRALPGLHSGVTSTRSTSRRSTFSGRIGTRSPVNRPLPGSALPRWRHPPLAESGVFLERAHIRSPRVSLGGVHPSADPRPRRKAPVRRLGRETRAYRGSVRRLQALVTTLRRRAQSGSAAARPRVPGIVGGLRTG